MVKSVSTCQRNVSVATLHVCSLRTSDNQLEDLLSKMAPHHQKL